MEKNKIYPQITQIFTDERKSENQEVKGNSLLSTSYL